MVSGVSAGRSESQNWTGSPWLAYHSARSQHSGSSGLSAAWRTSRPAGRIRRVTNREYIRLKPLRPVPGREPSRHCTGFAAFRPAAMTSCFTDCGLSGYFSTGRMSDPGVRLGDR